MDQTSSSCGLPVFLKWQHSGACGILLSASERSRYRQKNLSKSLPRPPTVILSEFAKEKGYDINYVLENYEQFGLAVEFPCMQCYDQHGRSSLVNTVMNSMYSYRKDEAGNHRCLSK